MKPKFALSRVGLAALGIVALFLIACPTSDTKDSVPVLNIEIDESNDSLMTFDTLIIKVYSMDSSFQQEVFHGKLTDPKKVMGIELDPRVGKQFRVAIIGYKDSKVGFNKEFTLLSPSKSESKALPIDTIKVDLNLPEIQVASDTAVSEGDSLRLRITVGNPWTGATLALKAPLTGARIDTSSLGSGHAYFTWRPTFAQGRSESYTVILLYAIHDRQIEQKISIKVLNVNRPPKIAPIENQKTNENETLTFEVEAADPDEDSLKFTGSAFPVGARFSGGTFEWKPTASQSGNYSINFKVSDGQDSDLVIVLISVGNVNMPPNLSFTSDTTIFENDSLILIVASDDPDGSVPKISIQGVPQLPEGCEVALDIPKKGYATVRWRPSFTQGRSEPYRFKINASDDSLQIEKTLTINVRNRNRAPSMQAIGNKAINIGDTIAFEVFAADPDGDSLSYIAIIPNGALFVGRNFFWSTKSTPEGNYSAAFKVTDGALLDSQTIVISVGKVNQPPEILPLEEIQAKQGDSLAIEISAIDPEGKNITLSAENMPISSSLIQKAPGKAIFSWKVQSAYDKDTTLTIKFSANDGELAGTRNLKINLKKLGPPPIADAGKDTAVSINDMVVLQGSVNIYASHPILWEWDFGSTGNFKKVSKADTTITVGGVATSPLQIVLKVTDVFGRVDTDTILVQVTDKNPKALAGADTLVGLYGSKMLVGRGEDDGGGLKFAWDIGNKGIFNESVDGRSLLSAQGELPREFNCVLRVTDNDGHSAYDTVNVNFNMDWKQVVPTGAFPGSGNGFLVHDNKFWIIGERGIDNDGVWYSDDGIDWKAATASAGWGKRSGFNTVVFKGAIWLFGGYAWEQANGNDGLKTDVWTTVDGKSWNKLSDVSGYPTSTYFKVMVSGGKLWMFTKVEGADFQVWSSVDGTNWTKVADSLPKMPDQTFTVEWFDGKFWIIGNNMDSTTSIAATSADGKTWEAVRGPSHFLPRNRHATAIYDGKLWVIAGTDDNTWYWNDVWYTADGKQWRLATSNGLFPARVGARTLVHNNKIWLLGGAARKSVYKDLWYTEDKP